ncbi:uncharacterized protein LOC123502823 [Portunus trituberculatus]|uniref:uncharacterized protein LOC123502823 n=1 Tax=Portunus trituberculatus TaxID=210409 RepID=UPI001E1CFFFB|nr:uncharacterized protein LOC123502823 [Portunus trituberculatus]
MRTVWDWVTATHLVLILVCGTLCRVCTSQGETVAGVESASPAGGHRYHHGTTTTTTTAESPVHSIPLTSQTAAVGRFLLSVVRIANTGCGADGSSGICYTATECRQRGGTAIGSCARGFGVCCYKEITCGDTTSTNCTYVVSPGYPSTYSDALTCTMTVLHTPDVCQLRFDFDTFETFPPDQFGVCQEDQFTVDGERKFTYLCGTAPANWHFYLDVAGKNSPTVLTFLTTTAAFRRRFKIKVSMIKCSQKVPGGCGQYLTGTSGVVQSFNYGGFYLAGLDYGICFRKEKGHCTTTLTTLGPSYTGCPDLYRLPVGQFSGTTGILGLDVGNMFCQLNIGFFPPFLSLASIPSPLTSVTHGPLTLWVQTLVDGLVNFNSNRNCPSCSGFFQQYMHNSC